MGIVPQFMSISTVRLLLGETGGKVNPIRAAETQTAVAEQFDDLSQQEHAATLGMWTFLATEVLFFVPLYSVVGWCRVFLLSSMTLCSASRGISS